jgi:hypothetical protein
MSTAVKKKFVKKVAKNEAKSTWLNKDGSAPGMPRIYACS